MTTCMTRTGFPSETSVIVDTSAVIAVIRAEPEADTFEEAFATAGVARISAATKLELAMVAGPRQWAHAEAFLTAARVKTVAFDSDQFDVARMAHERYGRGSGSPAKLNFGDCFSYALAKAYDEPLLFKGEDFTHTDIRSALP